MSRKMYSLDEIRDAAIYDSEGLFYGYVKDLDISLGVPRIIAVYRLKINDIGVDVEKLIDILMSRGVARGSEPLEVLISIARREGIDIPMKSIDREAEVVKGFIEVDEIDLIDISKIVRGDREELIKIVLLSTPREANFRGLPTGDRPQYRISDIIGKLVVSRSRGVLGYAEDIVVSSRDFGVRIYRVRGSKGYINWISFLSALKKLGFSKIYEKLYEFRDPYRFNRLDISYAKTIEDMLKELGASKDVYDLLKSSMVFEELPGEYIDISIKSILKVGDIVIAE